MKTFIFKFTPKHSHATHTKAALARLCHPTRGTGGRRSKRPSDHRASWTLTSTAEDPTNPSLRRDVAAVPSIHAMLLSTILQHYYRTFFPNVQPSMLAWNYLKSYAGAPDQPIHRNFASTTSSLDPLDATALPGSLLLATQDDTMIYGFGWNHQVAFQSEKNSIQLHKGGMILFRGDFIHARAGYDWNNLCVHTLLPSTSEHSPVSGQLIPLYMDKPRVDPLDCRCYVWGCRYQGPTKRDLSKHLCSHHNFMTRSPRNRGGGCTGEEPERAESNVLPAHQSALAIRVMVSLANAGVEFAEGEAHIHLDHSTPDFHNTDDDMEMEILIATDSDTETEIESLSDFVDDAV
jgi:hypothetical protein